VAGAVIWFGTLTTHTLGWAGIGFAVHLDALSAIMFVLVSFIVYAPATVLFVMARREQGRRVFSPGELVILVVSVAGAITGIVALAAGWISI